ncbi:hypothetical protein AB5N19_01891 [Seiridium cardinale]
MALSNAPQDGHHEAEPTNPFGDEAGIEEPSGTQPETSARNAYRQDGHRRRHSGPGTRPRKSSLASIIRRATVNAFSPRARRRDSKAPPELEEAPVQSSAARFSEESRIVLGDDTTDYQDQHRTAPAQTFEEILARGIPSQPPSDKPLGRSMSVSARRKAKFSGEDPYVRQTGYNAETGQRYFRSTIDE